VTGGDDNSVNVATVMVEFETCPNRSPKLTLLSRISKLNVHASAVQGVRFLDSKTLLTTSWDQRIHLWHVSENELVRIQSLLSQVADCSALDIIRDGENKCALAVVAGIGAEILGIRW